MANLLVSNGDNEFVGKLIESLITKHGVEVTALEAAYRLYPKEIVLLQHDGFTSTKPLDTKRIEAAMLEATGYRLEVEQKVIQVNLGDAFDAHPDDTNNQIEIGRKANAGAGSSHSTAS